MKIDKIVWVAYFLKRLSWYVLLSSYVMWCKLVTGAADVNLCWCSNISHHFQLNLCYSLEFVRGEILSSPFGTVLVRPDYIGLTEKYPRFFMSSMLQLKLLKKICFRYESLYNKFIVQSSLYILSSEALNVPYFYVLGLVVCNLHATN